MKRRSLFQSGFGAALVSMFDIDPRTVTLGRAALASDSRATAHYGGKYAPWNIPARQLPVDLNSDRIVHRFYEIAGAGPNINITKWCPAFYRIEDATHDVLCISKHPSWGNIHNTRVPWNPAWRSPDDTDAKVVVIGVHGHCYEFWQTSFENGILTVGSANLIQWGVTSDHLDQPADVRVKSNGYIPVRACGLPSVVCTILPEELERGFISHALDLSWNRPGKGQHVAPALKGAGNVGGGADRLPMGLRLVWDFTDDAIDAWVRTLDPDIRKGMRAIAVAMRDYGAIGCDGGGRKDGCSFRCVHDLTVDYRRLGFNSAKALRALDGLWEGSKAVCRVIAPPAFPNGDVTRTARYPGIRYPVDFS